MSFLKKVDISAAGLDVAIFMAIEIKMNRILHDSNKIFYLF